MPDFAQVVVIIPSRILNTVLNAEEDYRIVCGPYLYKLYLCNKIGIVAYLVLSIDLAQRNTWLTKLGI